MNNKAKDKVVELTPEAQPEGQPEAPALTMPDFTAQEWSFMNQCVERAQISGSEGLAVAMLLKKLDEVRAFLTSIGEVGD